MEYYIIERRKGGETEDANCFLGSSIDKCIEYINNNKDFDNRDFYWKWYWCIIKITVDDVYGGELIKIFDWNGQELDYQPI